MSIIKEKVVIFSFFGAISFFRFKKKSWAKSDVYALIWSGDWLPWLMSTRLRHQFSELFSVLFMKMNSYHPITALYYAWGRLTAENSNLMKEHRAVGSFLWTWPQQYLIWQHVECAWERSFCAEHHDGLITPTARIIVHFRTGASMFQVFVSIFHILSRSKHEPAPCSHTYHVFFKWNMRE